jgi:hypothetical protein
MAAQGRGPADAQGSAHLRMLGNDRVPQAAKGDVRFFQDAVPHTVPLARLSQLDSFLAIFDVSSRQKLNHYKGRGIENRCSEDLPPFRAF